MCRGREPDRDDDVLRLSVERFIGQPQQMPDPHLVVSVVPHASSPVGTALEQADDGLVLGQLDHGLNADT